MGKQKPLINITSETDLVTVDPLLVKYWLEVNQQRAKADMNFDKFYQDILGYWKLTQNHGLSYEHAYPGGKFTERK